MALGLHVVNAAAFTLLRGPCLAWQAAVLVNSEGMPWLQGLAVAAFGLLAGLYYWAGAYALLRARGS